MGIDHPSHQDTLVICKKADCGERNCEGCGQSCCGMIYGCVDCGFFLDGFCLDLPDHISHPSHPEHRLTLLPSASTFVCSSCSLPKSGFSYGCSSPACTFSLDVHCAVPSPIRHKFHPHRLLCFFDKWDGKSLSCNFCGKPCESLVLYCLECQFCIHLLCGPLPSSIHFEYCHEERLTLKPSLEADEDDSSDDDDVYGICDECDEEVKIHSPAYICRGCWTLVHIRCVITEVLNSLKGERAVELININEKAEQDGQRAEKPKTETLQDIMNSLDNSEKKDLDKILKIRVAEILKALAFRKKITLCKPNNRSPFLDEVFAEFMKRLNNLNIQHMGPLASDEYSEEVVAVGEYKVTWNLAPVLEHLFANYGDVSARSSSTSKVKTYVFVILCLTINSMLETKVGDISEALLYRWWSYLIFVHSSGFDIAFAIDRLKVVMRAHYSLQDKTNAAAKLDKEIVDLEDEIQELERKLKDKQAKLSGRNKKREKHGSPTKKSLREAYASKTLAWKW